MAPTRPLERAPIASTSDLAPSVFDRLENDRLRRLVAQLEEDLGRERRRHEETRAHFESELARLRQLYDPKGKGKAL